jgi:hypothetical protein
VLAVRVHDDVRAGLRHGQLDVGQRVIGDVKRLSEPAEGVTNHRHVLGACGEGQLEVRRLVLLITFRGVRPRLLGIAIRLHHAHRIVVLVAAMPVHTEEHGA